MPDLSNKASLEYWKGFQDPSIFRVISFMETVENWVVDGNPEIENALKELGDAMENVTKFELSKESNYLDMGCHLRTGRVLRILQAIDTISPGSASKVLMHAEENADGVDNAAGLFLRRNIVFERFRLLPRVFANERLNLIVDLLSQDEED